MELIMTKLKLSEEVEMKLKNGLQKHLELSENVVKYDKMK
jgi:hypothetical protein